jgi:HD-GYP domain-containing protein (c-di-GMP phosphodiesterase class II)
MAQKKIDLNQWLSNLERIEEKVRKLTRFSQISQLLNSTLEHQEVRRRAIEAVTGLIEAEVASLLLLDGDGRLRFEIALGGHEDTLKQVVLEPGEGIAGWVAKTGKPLIVNDPGMDEHFCGRVDGKIGFKTRNLLCVPVKVKRKVIGVLEAVNKKDGEKFTRDDLGLLNSLADQVAIALDNARLYGELEETFFQTAESLGEAIEKRDPYTGGHTKRVTQYSLAIARHLRLKSQDQKWLKIASALHDIGKIGIEDRILRKPDALSPEEFMEIQRHSGLGAEILSHIRQLRRILPGVKYHHEQVDGKGYPEGLQGEDIPILARIVAVADTWDAMTTDRPYRKARDRKGAIRELKKCAGTQLDKDVVAAFLRACRTGDI